MKYIDEFRDQVIARQICQRIHAEVKPDRHYAFMEFCGGHTHAIARYGLSQLLPTNVKMIHGPGCPVCVLPIERVQQAIDLSLKNNVILCTYGDCLKSPAQNKMTLLKAKAQGADVRMIYSAADALKIAQENPNCEVVFFAIGFETTTPPTALVVQQAAAHNIQNFSILCCHVLTPPAISHILQDENVALDGFIGPAHVSLIIGADAYRPFVEHYRKPVVIAGFEPLDVLQSILMLIRQVNDARSEVENEFIRAVSNEGNQAAQAAMRQVFQLRDHFRWRGLGSIAYSALRLAPNYQAWDAEVKFNLTCHPIDDHKGCECGAVLRGLKEPEECKLFGKACTPETAFGSCMVSSEGACAARYLYGK